MFAASTFKHAIVLGRQVLIIDTPGLLNTSKEENKLLCKITSDNNKLAPYAVILVLPVGRFTDEDVLTVEQLKKHFGENIFKHTLVAFTGFDDYKREMENQNITTFNINKYVLTLPNNIEDIINVKCNGRLIDINKRVTGSKSEKQVQQLFNLVDNIITENDNSLCTNDDFRIGKQQVMGKMYNNFFLRSLVFLPIGIMFSLFLLHRLQSTPVHTIDISFTDRSIIP